MSGWYEYGFRWYDAAIGRFTGVDPIADQFAWVSVFNYAENSPIVNIDLHGLQAVSFEIATRRDDIALLKGHMTREEYVARQQARGTVAIVGMGIGITVLGGGNLARMGAGWILRNPVVATEAAKTIGGVMWGLTTDQDMPGVRVDDAGRALKYGPLREGLVGAVEKVVKHGDDAVKGVPLNRLNHIFGKSEHALESLVRKFGSQEGAYNAVQNAANQALKSGKLTPNAKGILPSGNLGNIIKVDGMDVRLIGGRVENGQVILSSFSRKGL